MIAHIRYYSILLILIMCMAFFLSGLVYADTDDSYYENGNYAIYSITAILVGYNTNYPPGAGNQNGQLEFKVVNNDVMLTLTLNNGVQKSIALTIQNGKLYDGNTEVKLPFFYTGDKVISHYGKHWENVTGIDKLWGNSDGGPANGQSLLDISTSTNARYFSNGTSEGDLEFDADKHLLVQGGYSSFNILSADIINLTYYNDTYNIQTMHLIKTNINLGSPNYAGLILVTLIMSWPIIAGAGIIVVVLIWHNRAAKNRRSKKSGRQKGGVRNRRK